MPDSPAQGSALSTTTWVVLLRGINVGRNKRLAMADLRELLSSLGYENVRTHGQSGNALVTTANTAAPALERSIASRIAADLGLDVKVLVRKAGELAAVMEANPFVARGVSAKELHVAFLSSAPVVDRIDQLDRESFAPEEYELGASVIYLRLPGGVQASKLPDWERLLGFPVTIRNWNTVSKLREFCA